MDQWTTADFKDGGVSANVCTPICGAFMSIYRNIQLSLHLILKFLKSEWRKLGTCFMGVLIGI